MRPHLSLYGALFGHRVRAPAIVSLWAVVLVVCIGATETTLLAQANDLGRFDRALQRLVEKVSPSVVSIRLVAHSVPANGGTTVFGEGRRVLYQGSGVIGSGDGEVISIIPRGKPEQELRPGERLSIEVSLDGGALHSARWIAADPETGITLLAVDSAPESLPTVRYASEPPARGATVVAIGSGGMQLGHVVHPARGVRLGAGTFPRAIVTNIEAQPGDVGGLLANAEGELVGLLAFSLAAEDRARPTGETGQLPGGRRPGGRRPGGERRLAVSGRGARSGAEASTVGRAVAIPVDLLQKIAGQLRSAGEMARGALGATFEFHHPALAGTTHYGAGALLRKLVPGAAADQDGLQVGDVVQKVDGREIHRAEDLLWFRERVEYGVIGEPLTLEVARMEQRRVVPKTLRVRIGARPDETGGTELVPPRPTEDSPRGTPASPGGDEQEAAPERPPEKRTPTPGRRR